MVMMFYVVRAPLTAHFAPPKTVQIQNTRDYRSKKGCNNNIHIKAEQVFVRWCEQV